MLQDLKKRPNFLDHQLIIARREGTSIGVWVGLFVGLVLFTSVHIVRVAFIEKKNQEVVRAAVAKERILMDECKSIVRDLADEEYDVVLDYRHRIDDLQGRAR